MQLSENAHEVLEELWGTVEEQDAAGLEIDDAPSPGMEELVKEGLAAWDGGRLTLTPDGRPHAAQAIRRHRLAERLLVDVLSTEEARMEEHACRFEHVLANGVSESICTLLGHPRFCPHGKPIPPGRCCQERDQTVERLIAPLRELQAGQKGEIAYIRMDKPRRLQKLMAMGVLPGVPITLQRRLPSFVFQVGHSQFAVDEAIAADIYVRLSH